MICYNPHMNAKTELLLYRLMWLAEKPLSPTYSNLEQSFEGWAYRNGLLYQIRRLEAQGLLEASQDPITGKRLHRLTEAGCAVALEGRNPVTNWARPWDNKWRLILFDIPEIEKTKRRRLNRALTQAGCGCLQGSVWIAPLAPPGMQKFINEDDADCKHLLLLQAESKGPKVDAKMVAGAWKFSEINAAYQELQVVLEQFSEVESCEALTKWTAHENAATRRALRLDPFLPSVLLPTGYRGKTVWRLRSKILAKAAKLARSLNR